IPTPCAATCTTCARPSTGPSIARCCTPCRPPATASPTSMPPRPADAMPHRKGLRRKIWTALILQAAAISFAAVLGVYGASAVLKHVLIQQALQEEAAHYWQRMQANPGAEVPDTYNMTGYLLPAGADASRVPETIRSLAPGFHALPR